MGKGNDEGDLGVTRGIGAALSEWAVRNVEDYVPHGWATAEYGAAMREAEVVVTGSLLAFVAPLALMVAAVAFSGYGAAEAIGIAEATLATSAYMFGLFVLRRRRAARVRARHPVRPEGHARRTHVARARAPRGHRGERLAL